MAKTVNPAKKTKQEKLLEKEEKKRERRIMKEKAKQYDGGFMSRCVALLIGFILGIIGTIGGAGGLGYYFISKKTIKEVANYAGSSFDINKYLASEYTEKTLLEFFQNFNEISGKLKGAEACIDSLAEISPYVSELADTLSQKLSDFGLDVDTAKLKSTPFKQLQTFLQDTLQSTRLGKFIGAKPDGTLMGLLCYGEEGVNYTLDENGNIVWIGDSHELTVGDFMDNNDTADIFKRLSLKAVMSTSGEVKSDDPITRALVYGTKGVDYYLYTDADGNEAIGMLPLTYTFDYDEAAGKNVLTDDHGKAVSFFKVNGAYIEVREKESDETPSLYLQKDAADGVWYAYPAKEDCGTKEKRVLHKFTSLGDIMKGDFMGMAEGVELASLLQITAESEGAMIALAYGNEGVDYKITEQPDGEGNVTKTIEMLGKSKPRTIKDLRAGNVKFEDLELGSVLKIKPHDGSNDRMINLAYGEEGKHYTFDEATKKITWLPKRYIEQADGLYRADGNKIEDAVRGADGMWSFTENGISYKTVLPDGAIGLGKHTFYIYADGDGEKTPVCYKARTISDLKNLQTSDLIGGATLESMLNIGAGTDDGVLKSLAYGKNGVNYVIEDGKIVMQPIKYTLDGTNWTDETGGNVSPTATPAELGDGVYEFLRSKDGVTQYVYAKNVSGNGEYRVCDALGAELTHKKRTIDALKSNNATQVFNEIELCEVIKPDTTDKINMYLLYGKENRDYTIVDGKIKCDAPKTIGDMRKTGDDSIFKKLKNELTIGEILGEEQTNGNKILRNLKGATLNSLGEQINGLRIVDVFEDEIYKNSEGKYYDINKNEVAKNEDGTFYRISDNALLEKDELQMNGTWKYLLKDPTGGKTPSGYTINDMGTLTDNMTENIKTTSLGEMDADLNLNLSRDFLDMNLDSTVKASMVPQPQNDHAEHVRDLTIVEVSRYVPALIKYYQEKLALLPSA